MGTTTTRIGLIGSLSSPNMARRMPTSRIMLFVALASMLSCGHCCVELIGHAADSLVHHDNSTQWDYGFLGDDWEGNDTSGHPWICHTGRTQSPINFPPIHKMRPQPKGVKTKFKWNARPSPEAAARPLGQVFNNGHTIQVQNFSYNLVGISVPKLANITSVLSSSAGKHKKFDWLDVPALQFHFHTASEHELEGESTALELHVVHKTGPGIFSDCPNGCYAVVGVMVRIHDGPDHAELAPIFDNAPFHEGESRNLPAGLKLDFSKIYPPNKAYMTYQGSLTTPPCTQGILWHVMVDPIYISTRQFRQYRNAIGSKVCTGTAGSANANCTLAGWGQNYRLPQPLHKRHVYFAR